MGAFQGGREVRGGYSKHRLELLAHGRGHGSVAGTYNNTAIVEGKRGNLQKALELDEKPLEVKITCVGHSHAGAWPWPMEAVSAHDSDSAVNRVAVGRKSRGRRQ
jgi:hypothetical protein